MARLALVVGVVGALAARATAQGVWAGAAAPDAWTEASAEPPADEPPPDEPPPEESPSPATPPPPPPAEADPPSEAAAAADDGEQLLDGSAAGSRDWARLAARADAPLEELSRLMGSATSAIETYHRRFESSLGGMSPERILSAVRGAALANAIALLLYAPLTAFVALVSGRLGRCLHATYAGIAGWALVLAEMPVRVRGQSGSIRFLSSQLGRSSALVFAAAVAWRSGPVGMLVSALTTLNALYGVYVAAVHPTFRPELDAVADVARGLASVGRQLWRAVLRVLNAATDGHRGAAAAAAAGGGRGASAEGAWRSGAQPRGAASQPPREAERRRGRTGEAP